MEQCTISAVIIVHIIMVNRSDIILTSSKTRNSECSNTLTNRLSNIDISTIDGNSHKTCRISDRNGYSYCLIIQISDISRNHINCAVCRAYMEESTAILIIIIHIIMVNRSDIILANNKTRNSESHRTIIILSNILS